METERRLRPALADAIRIIALTGARRGEITGLRWQHVDLKRGVFTLPAKAHKTGHKTGKPRVISLPAAAQQIIARQPEGAPESFVFSRSKGGPVLLSKAWRTVRVEADLPAGIGLHGLRHSLLHFWPSVVRKRRKSCKSLDTVNCPRLNVTSTLPTKPAPPWPSALPRPHWRAWPLQLARLTPTSLRCPTGRGGRDGRFPFHRKPVGRDQCGVGADGAPEIRRRPPNARNDLQPLRAIAPPAGTQRTDTEKSAGVHGAKWRWRLTSLTLRSPACRRQALRVSPFSTGSTANKVSGKVGRRSCRS